MKHRAKSQRWWRRHLVASISLVVVVALLLAALGYVISVAATPLQPATLTAQLGTSVTAPQKADPIAWPVQGEGSFAIPIFHVAQDSPNQTAVPIGSLTKLMTAYVILKDYPLSPGQQGPSITISDQDVTTYDLETLDGQSTVKVASGETLTEYQLLQGLLVHSANNFALLLAQFDAGAESLFVAKMNAQAQGLQMAKTHYNDASGLDPASISTPHDQLLVAQSLMANPVFAGIVVNTSVTLPVAGSVGTFQPLLGTNGVVGVKSGLTSQAAGCDVMAVNATVAGQTIQILTAVTGQHGTNRLAAAGDAALALAHGAQAGIDTVVIVGTKIPVATFGWPGEKVGIFVDKPMLLPAWPGQVVHVTTTQVEHVAGPLAPGVTVATIDAASPTFHVTEPAKNRQELHEPTLWQRLW